MSVFGLLMRRYNLTEEEHASLHRQLRETRAVKITCTNDSPVYARAQLDGIFSKFIGRDVYKVLFRPFSLVDERWWKQQQQQPKEFDPLAPCSQQDLNSLEVQVGALRFEMRPE
jgi:hypothetical protein